MSGRKLRLDGLGLVATAGAGVLGWQRMMNPAPARADDIGLVIGGSGDPDSRARVRGVPPTRIYLNNPFTGLYPDLTFYQGVPATRRTWAPSATASSRPRGSIRCSSAASTSCI